ncbi:MAG: NAD+ synthase [Anaerolineae bacterium]|nr:NAD+ synthase [Anaerolineales bacterium]MCQ3975482.1 NAD+ synthase [Anaerolineae bacterium]
MTILRIALAQINATVGDIQGNAAKIIEYLEKARVAGANIVLFPELSLAGYPPEDLLLKPGFAAANRAALESLLPHTAGLTAVVGFVDRRDDLFNAAAVLHQGQLAGIYHKALLPNYAVFDEDRYFAKGDTSLVFTLPVSTPDEVSSKEVCFGVSVCEDIWYPAGPPEAQAAAGAELLLNISASPYQSGKIKSRERMLATRAADNVAIVAFCNLVCGQDELIFDGSSVIFDERGNLLARGKSFAEDLVLVDVNLGNVFRQRLRDPRRRKDGLTEIYADTFQRVALPPLEIPAPRQPLVASPLTPPLERVEEVYQALVLGTRDYVCKNGFSKVTLGLSGGVDSSLVATIAVDALGAENVIGVSMPSRYSSEHSKSDAAELARRLNIRCEVIPIEPAYQAYLEMLGDIFAATRPNEAEENLQSRARGNTLMALSNKFGWLVLTTGNKSEMAVGYATIYGDMAGGFAVIKDVPKTLVYELCRYRNEKLSPVIPESVLTKPPSAELRPNQKDTDSLPEYDILDAILAAYVEEDYSAAEIVALGFDEDTVRRVIRMVDRNEYKRRQAPPGPKITSKAFGKDRRLPITNRYTG